MMEINKTKTDKPLLSLDGVSFLGGAIVRRFCEGKTNKEK